MVLKYNKVEGIRVVGLYSRYGHAIPVPIVFNDHLGGYLAFPSPRVRVGVIIRSWEYDASIRHASENVLVGK